MVESGFPETLIAIVGPTAVGKTSVALELAERLDGEIVNADSLQVYRGLDLGTAKPTAEERNRVPHHLLDILNPDEEFSAGEFVRRARPALAEIAEHGRAALLVGGSGLYLRALLDGISPMPTVPPEVREELMRQLESEGLASLRRELERVDPETARRVEENDPQRTVRALEVARASGRPLSSWQSDRPFGERPLQAFRIGLTLPRAILYDRISARVGRMLRDGWVEEVRGLLDAGLRPSARAFQALGYRELVLYIRGELALEEATERIVRATRRFAKRQWTWFRRDPRVRWLPSDGPRTVVSEILAILDRDDPGRGHVET